MGRLLRLQGRTQPLKTLLVDTSVWSLAFRRDTPPDVPHAAGLRTTCRQGGVQIGTIDALIAQLAIHHGLTLLTTDQDFAHAAKHRPLRLWAPGSTPGEN